MDYDHPSRYHPFLQEAFSTGNIQRIRLDLHDSEHVFYRATFVNQKTLPVHISTVHEWVRLTWGIE